MSLEHLHVAVFSICPEDYRPHGKADNVLFLGDNQRDVWRRFSEWYHETEDDRDFTTKDVWVLSFDILMDWREEPPTDPDTGEYDEEWWDPNELLYNLEEMIANDPTFLGPGEEGPMTEDDIKRNALWIAGDLMIDQPVVQLGIDVFDPRCEPYAVWRSRLYRSEFSKAS